MISHAHASQGRDSRLLAALACVLTLSAASQAAACENPPLPMIPPEEQVADRIGDILRDVRRYRDEMVEYVACIQAEIEAAGGASAQTLRTQLLVRRNNLAVEEGAAVADLFTQRVGPASLLAGELLETQWTRCISLSRLESARVLGDRVLLFHTRRGNVHLNVLETSCPELRSREFVFDPREMWAGRTDDLRGLRLARTARICHKHLIYAVDTSTGVYEACRLGPFYTMSEAQAELLLAEPSEPLKLLTIQ